MSVPAVFQPDTSPGSAASVQGPSSAALVVPPGQSCFKAEDPSLAFCSQSCYCCHLRESSCRQDKGRGNPLKALVDVGEGSEDSPSWTSALFAFTVSGGLCVFSSCAAPRFPLDRALVFPDAQSLSSDVSLSLQTFPLSILTSFAFPSCLSVLSK